MSAAKTGKSSPLAEFFCKASPETKRDVFIVAMSKAIASQRDVLDKAEAIKSGAKSREGFCLRRMCHWLKSPAIRWAFSFLGIRTGEKGPQHDAPAAGWIKSITASAQGLIAEQVAKGNYKKSPPRSTS